MKIEPENEVVKAVKVCLNPYSNGMKIERLAAEAMLVGD